MSTGERRAELDGVRGVAILLVLIGHGGVPYMLGPFAAAGVTMFFALSGYLITGILTSEHERSGRVDLRHFYARRMTRLAPPLFVMLAVVAVVARPDWLAMLPPLTWTANYAVLAGVDFYPFGHTWSLGVEEQFYLLWPLALGALLRRGKAARVVFWLCLVLLAWRVLLTVEGHLQYAYVALETAGVPILCGALVSLAGWRLRGWWATVSLGWVVVAVFVGYAFAGGAAWLVTPLLVTPAAVCLVAAAGSAPWLAWPPLAFCGVASYSLYLWHTPVTFIVEGREAAVGVAVGAAVGVVAYFLVEAPLMRWRSANAERPVARLDRAPLHDALPARQP